jgi:DNA polymerase I-like protein with 3'-5' exonuclease and polymerase domains
VPLGHVNSDISGDLLASASAPAQLNVEAALDRLKPLFEDESVRKVGHDLKIDTIVLARYWRRLAWSAFDSMLASYLLDATRAHSARGHGAFAHRLQDVGGRGRLRARGEGCPVCSTRTVGASRLRR